MRSPRRKTSETSIVRRSGTSLAHQIFLVIRDQISAGRYPVGSTLPSEKQLSRDFQVSRITVRAALASLERNGLVDRCHGVGTFVTERAQASPLHAPMRDMLAHIDDVSHSTQVKLREVSYVNVPLHIQSLFNCRPDQRFQRAIRIRSLNGLPILHIMTLLPEPIAQQFGRKELAGASLYELLRKKGYHFSTGKQVISATLATPTVAKELRLEVGAALIQVRRIHFDQFKRPFEYMEYLASPAHFEIQMTLEGEDSPEHAQAENAHQ